MSKTAYSLPVNQVIMRHGIRAVYVIPNCQSLKLRKNIFRFF